MWEKYGSPCLIDTDMGLCCEYYQASCLCVDWELLGVVSHCVYHRWDWKIFVENEIERKIRIIPRSGKDNLDIKQGLLYYTV